MGVPPKSLKQQTEERIIKDLGLPLYPREPEPPVRPNYPVLEDPIAKPLVENLIDGDTVPVDAHRIGDPRPSTHIASLNYPPLQNGEEPSTPVINRLQENGRLRPISVESKPQIAETEVLSEEMEKVIEELPNLLTDGKKFLEAMDKLPPEIYYAVFKILNNNPDNSFDMALEPEKYGVIFNQREKFLKNIDGVEVLVPRYNLNEALIINGEHLKRKGGELQKMPGNITEGWLKLLIKGDSNEKRKIDPELLIAVTARKYLESSLSHEDIATKMEFDADKAGFKVERLEILDLLERGYTTKLKKNIDTMLTRLPQSETSRAGI